MKALVVGFGMVVVLIGVILVGLPIIGGVAGEAAEGVEAVTAALDGDTVAAKDLAANVAARQREKALDSAIAFLVQYDQGRASKEDTLAKLDAKGISVENAVEAYCASRWAKRAEGPMTEACGQ